MMEMGNLTWMLVLTGILTVSYVESAKVMLLPLNMGSHVMYFGQVASALAETGHEATLYVPSNNKPPQDLSPKVKVVIYKVPGDIPYINSAEWAQVEINLLKAESFIEWFQLGMKGQESIQANWGEECEALFAPDVYKEIAGSGFDLAVMEPMNYPCMYTLPYKLGIRYVSLSIPFAQWSYRVPHFPSVYPNPNSGSGSRMNFGQRLKSFLLDMMEVVILNTTDHYIRKYAPERPAVSGRDLIFNSTMWWYLYDLAVGHPKASMPDTLDIGDIMVRPAKPLPKDYLDIMQAAEHGAILVSLGSHFDVVPETWLQDFCKAFNSLKYDVIWKLKINPPCKLSPNVHVRSWVPQNDLLAHPKLVLFVTHCGYNSLLEGASHGKPMVGFPITLDQPNNAQIIQEKGIGEILSLAKFKADELSTTIERVVSDPTYRKKAQRVSELLHNKPQKPAERISFWVNHVMEFGDSHLKSAAKELNIIQFLMIDIYAFLLSTAMLIVCMMFCCMRWCCRCVKKLCRIDSSRKEHKD